MVDLPAEAGPGAEEVCATLAELGFDSEPFGNESVLIRAVPAVLAERRAVASLLEALAALTDGTRGGDWRARLSVELACKTAVKAGDSLATDEQEALLERLGEARLGETCAHGRPTSLLLSHGQLARQFGR